MYAQHAVVGRVVALRVVVRRDELVVVLAPREDGAPVRQRVGHHRQAVAPRLHDGLHVVQRRGPAVQQALLPQSAFYSLDSERGPRGRRKNSLQYWATVCSTSK